MDAIVRETQIITTWDRIAREFGASPSTVRRWKKDGAPIYYIDGKWRCEKAELWAWLTSRKGAA